MAKEERTKRVVSFDQIPSRQRASLEAQLPKTSLKSGCLVLLIVIGILFNLIFGGDDEESSKSSSSQTVTSESQKVEDSTRTKSTSQSEPKKTPEINPSEFNLSLGGLKIGDTVEQMHKILGQENKITDSQTPGHKHYEYKDIVVTVKDDTFVSGLVSYTDKVQTEKALRQGSALKDVLATYGRSCVLSEYDGTSLYEYPFESAGSKVAVMRFAVKSNFVDYISLRLVDDAEKNNLMSNVRTVDDNSQSVHASSDEETARQTFLNYHKAITNKNYREAYDILSFAQRERVGDYNSYVSGFADTLSSEVSEIKLKSSENGVYTFDYTLTARDRYQNNRVKVQTFKGEVTMAKDKGRWYVRHAKSSKVNEKIE